MNLTANRESTNETVSPKKFLSDAISKHFTGKQAQKIIRINAEFILFDKSEYFYLTDSKMLKRRNSIMAITIREQTRK